MAIKLQISFYIILSGFVKGILIMDLLYMVIVAGFVIIGYLYKRLLAWWMAVSVLIICFAFFKIRYVAFLYRVLTELI